MRIIEILNKRCNYCLCLKVLKINILESNCCIKLTIIEWFYLTHETVSNDYCLIVKVEQKKTMELMCYSA